MIKVRIEKIAAIQDEIVMANDCPFTVFTISLLFIISYFYHMMSSFSASFLLVTQLFLFFGYFIAIAASVC